MTAIGGRRVAAGAAPARVYSKPRGDANPPWPGITAGHDARCQCTWAMWQGVMQVKYLNRECPNRTVHRG